ncbi:CLUMA_CG009630, isoform A [Clunio marinus]|uniref:CLUMA_CG009630, isoform A n=1 Tax=Clunio marinus TaxID=568069 RepID=A0A1J1I900_9DIPT|nr:CLUMA_CG009630, isoform A [Clunio marinus]
MMIHKAFMLIDINCFLRQPFEDQCKFQHKYHYVMKEKRSFIYNNDVQPSIAARFILMSINLFDLLIHQQRDSLHGLSFSHFKILLLQFSFET